MKSLFLLFTFTIFLAPTSLGQQTGAFTLRPGLSDNGVLTGLTRGRFATETTAETLRATATRLEREAFDLLNATRARNGLEQLTWSEEVAVVARLHSRSMAEHNYFSHRGIDGSMVDERADRLGLTNWQSIGENIAYMRGYDKPAQLAVEKWMDSSAHRKNLLAPNWKDSAVGVAVKPDGTYYFTQVFVM